MAKSKTIGTISFSAKGYEHFTTLTRNEQIEYVYNNSTPKDRKKAEKLLNNIPHGNISDGNVEAIGEDNTNSITGGDVEDNNARPETDSGESKGVQKGRKSR